MPPSQTTFQIQEKQRFQNTFLRDIEKSVKSTTLAALNSKQKIRPRLNRELLERRLVGERAVLANTMANIARELLKERVALAERRADVEKNLGSGKYKYWGFESTGG